MARMVMYNNRLAVALRRYCAEMRCRRLRWRRDGGLAERRWQVAHQGGGRGAATRERVGADGATRLLGRP